MQDIRTNLQQQGLTPSASDYITAAWRTGTQKQYNSHLKKWFNFCDMRNWHYRVFTVPSIIDFLVHVKDDLKLSVKSVSGARAAIGAYAASVHVKYSKITEHELIGKLGNRNPPVKKYQQLWDPQTVLNYLKTLPNNKDLTLLQLSRKVVMLIALVSGSRCQTLHKLQDSRITKNPDCYCCNLPAVLKTNKYGDKEHVVHLPVYKDPALCVYRAMKEYLRRTKPLRQKGSDQVFIISREPFTPAARGTISRWIKECMEASGIDVDIYTAHSTRKAATSAASEASVPLATILRAAGWASRHTFARYYQLPIVSHSEFADGVLTGVSTMSTHGN